MKKIGDRTIDKLKRKNIWPHIVSFFISLILGAVVVAIMLVSIVTYMTESKHMDAINNVFDIENMITDRYEKGQSFDNILNAINDDNSKISAIAVTDKEGKIISSHGDVLNLAEDVVVTDDFDVNIILEPYKYHDGDVVDKQLWISVSDIFKGANVLKLFGGQSMDGKSVYRLKDEFYSYSYWIMNPERNQDYDIYIKYNLSFNANDILFLFAIAILSGIVFAVLAVKSLATAICNIFAQRKMFKLIMTDNVTGGNNYVAFQNMGKKIICSSFNRKKAYAVVSISLLKYQSYCTLYGTDEGEKLLYTIISYLNKQTKKKELVARVANADYVMLLSFDENEQTIEAMNNRISQILTELPEGIRRIECSDKTYVQGLKNTILKAGVYVVDAALDEEKRSRRDKKTLDMEQLHIKAEIAKKALMEGETLMFYTHEMWEEDIWEQKVEETMEDALAREEFQVYIQPKYNPSTDKLAGGEALVRWISPTDGFISPGKFIPIFEKTGFVTKLDDYMISHTAKLQSEWLAGGREIVPISVNVSRAHFAQPDLAEHIRDLVDEYPLPHKYIEIELTESAFFDDKKALITTVTKLQEYGFEVSMDDFGSGYSSLNSLKDLPLNVLKLDAEFFRGEDFDGRGEIVVSKAIALAKQLNMRIVAEGVEKREQVDFLASQDCDMIQGFYYDKPMPAVEYATRMK